MTQHVAGSTPPPHRRDTLTDIPRRPVDDAVTHAYVLEGLARAAGRMQQARLERDPCEMFVAVGDTLLWVMALDDRFARFGQYSNRKRTHTAGVQLTGLRFAWNLLKHSDLDDIIDLSEGLGFPVSFPVVFFELVWKPRTALPAMRATTPSTAQQRSYDDALAGKPVRSTLGAAVDFITEQALLLGYQRRGLPASALPPGITPRPSQLPVPWPSAALHDDGESKA